MKTFFSQLRWARLAAVAAFTSFAAACGSNDVTIPPPGAGLPTYEVTVATTGSGSVAAAAIAIDCGTACKATVAEGTTVILTASAATGFVFSGWGGACAGTLPSCSVAIAAATNLSASFTPVASATFRLTITNTGNGATKSQPSGIDCGASCTASFASATSVTLTATPATGQEFSGWGGDCSGTAVTCMVQMSANRTANAMFRAVTPPIPIGWRAPEVISKASEGSNGSARVVIDNAGNALAIWKQRNATNVGDVLWARRYVPGSGWGNLVELLRQTSTSGEVRSAEIAIDPISGKAIASWAQRDETIYGIKARLFDPATGWAALATIDNLATSTVDPVPAIDSSGNAIVVWRQLQGVTNTFIFANRYTAAGGWGTAALIDNAVNPPSVSGSPRLAMASNGTAFAVWRRGGSGLAIKSGVWGSKYTPGSGWSTETKIATMTANGIDLNLPEVAVDNNGNAMLTWGQVDVAPAITSNVWSLRYSNGAWSTTPLQVGPALPVNTFVGSRLKVGAQGQFAVTWLTDNEKKIWVNRTRADGSWETAQVVNVGTPGTTRSKPDVGIDDQGNMRAVWSVSPDAAGIGDKTAGNSFTPAAGWGTAEYLESYDPITAFGAEASVAVNAKGNAAAVWTQVLDIVRIGSQIVGRYFNSGR